MEENLRQEDRNIVKIVLFGPESSGKTTLSEQLARHYNSVWIPEFAREYLQHKWNVERKICEYEDLIPIAVGQMALENEAAQQADRILICDTDCLETMVYSEEFYDGKVDPRLEEAALENSYDLYLLTDIDTPWIADDLRDRPHQREEMFKAFKAALEKYKKPYILVSGDRETRLKTAVTAIDKILDSRPNLQRYP